MNGTALSRAAVVEEEVEEVVVDEGIPCPDGYSCDRKKDARWACKAKGPWGKGGKWSGKNWTGKKGHWCDACKGGPCA